MNILHGKNFLFFSFLLQQLLSNQTEKLGKNKTIEDESLQRDNRRNRKVERAKNYFIHH